MTSTMFKILFLVSVAGLILCFYEAETCGRGLGERILARGL